MMPDDDRQSRRRFLMLIVAAVGGVLGAGVGQLTSDEGGEGDGGNGGNEIDLSVDTTGTPNAPAETGTPTEDGTTTGGSSNTTSGGQSSGVTTTTAEDGDDNDPPTTDPGTTTTDDNDDNDRTVDTETTTTDSEDGTNGTTTSPENSEGGETEDGSETEGGSETGTGTRTDGGDGTDDGTVIGTKTGEDDGPKRIAVTTSPIAFTEIVPGDEGTVTVTLSLSGGSARLWVRGDASRFEERGLIEPERDAGDHDRQGELQEHVRVQLRYEEGGIPDGGRVLQEGSLASLADTSWTSLVEGCTGPGEYELTLEWRLPADTPNTVQSDAAQFSLGFLGESCSDEVT